MTLSPLLLSYLVLLLVTAVLGVSVYALFRHHGHDLILKDTSDSAGPAIDTQVTAEQAALIDRLTPSSGRPVPIVVLFTSTSCVSCRLAKDEINAFASSVDEAIVVVVCAGPENQIRTYHAGLHASIAPIADPQSEMLSAWYVPRVPYFVGVDAGRYIRDKGPFRDRRSAMRLLSRLAGHSTRPTLV
jgi:hypothetical protein